MREHRASATHAVSFSVTSHRAAYITSNYDSRFLNFQAAEVYLTTKTSLRDGSGLSLEDSIVTDQVFISETVLFESLSTSAIDKRVTSSGTTPPPSASRMGLSRYISLEGHTD